MSKNLSDLQAKLASTSSPHAKKVILDQIRKFHISAREEEADLRASIHDCRSCALGDTRNKAIPWSGPPRGRVDLVFVDMAPGVREDSRGVPLVGQSGVMLEHALTQAGISRDDCAVMYAVSCHPPVKTPTPRSVNACKPNYQAQLSMVDCPVGVTLGTLALAHLLNKTPSSVKFGSMQGKPIWVAGRIWVPTYHPDYVAENKKVFSAFVEDIQFALALRFAEDRPLPTPIWEQVEIDSKPGKDFGPVVEKKGFALIHSSTLGTQIVMTKDEGVIVPTKIAHLPRYTVNEMIRAGLIGEGRRWNKSELRRMHMVKTELGGMVVAG